MQALLPFPAPPLERPGELARRLTSCWQSHCSHKKIGGQIKVRVVIPGTFNTRMAVYYYFRNNTISSPWLWWNCQIYFWCSYVHLGTFWKAWRQEKPLLLLITRWNLNLACIQEKSSMTGMENKGFLFMVFMLSCYHSSFWQWEAYRRSWPVVRRYQARCLVHVRCTGRWLCLDGEGVP